MELLFYSVLLNDALIHAPLKKGMGKILTSYPSLTAFTISIGCVPWLCSCMPFSLSVKDDYSHLTPTILTPKLKRLGKVIVEESVNIYCIIVLEFPLFDIIMSISCRERVPSEI